MVALDLMVKALVGLIFIVFATVTSLILVISWLFKFIKATVNNNKTWEDNI